MSILDRSYCLPHGPYHGFFSVVHLCHILKATYYAGEVHTSSIAFVQDLIKNLKKLFRVGVANSVVHNARDR